MFLAGKDFSRNYEVIQLCGYINDKGKAVELYAKLVNPVFKSSTPFVSVFLFYYSCKTLLGDITEHFPSNTSRTFP